MSSRRPSGGSKKARALAAMKELAASRKDGVRASKQLRVRVKRGRARRARHAPHTPPPLQLEEEEDVFDTVDEADYQKMVQARRGMADFVVDDRAWAWRGWPLWRARI